MSKLSPEEREKLEAEIKEDQARLAAEKQTMLEMSLTHEIGEQNLQFKPILAKLYADNKYDLMWKTRLRKNNSYVNMRPWLRLVFLNVRRNH